MIKVRNLAKISPLINMNQLALLDVAIIAIVIY